MYACDKLRSNREEPHDLLMLRDEHLVNTLISCFFVNETLTEVNMVGWVKMSRHIYNLCL